MPVGTSFRRDARHAVTTLATDGTTMTERPTGSAAARSHLDRHGAAVLREFAELVAIPNESRDLDGVRANAAWIVDALTRRGVDARTHERDGVAPLVVGHLPAQVDDPVARIGLYVHYDGQPVDPVGAWTFPPFAPTLTTGPLEDGGEARPFPDDGEDLDPEWRLYARGTGDDRAPVAALLAAVDALTAGGIPRTVDVVLAFEGEEEIGSPHLDDHLRDLSDELAADLWIVCDGPVHHSRAPQVVFGVRGFCGFDLTVYGPSHDLHSGHYGNWIPNPALRLAHLLASMRTPDGTVTIADFEDDTAPVTDAEAAAVDALPDDEAALLHDLRVARPERDERLVTSLLRPSLNVRGLACGGVGDNARNVLPATATASVDIRLAAGDDPTVMLDRVRRHLVAQGAHVVEEEPDATTRRTHDLVVRLDAEVGYPGVRTPMDLPIARRVVDAVTTAHGAAPVLVPTFGGSVPMHGLATVLDAPLVIVPIANHDDNQHAPDENLRVGNLLDGTVTMAALLTMA